MLWRYKIGHRLASVQRKFGILLIIDNDKWEACMEIRPLQSFIALAEEGQFTAAARKLNIVQSGLSVTIKEMEQELGVQLVNRTTRNLSLTHAGELFLEYARSSLATLNDGMQAVRSQDGVVRGRLHLGILQSLGPYVDLPAVLESFRTKYPQVEFAVRSLNTGEIPGLVRSGYVDLSFHAMISNKSGF
jgi:DNA-binding transcriptional LysR family regulator